MGLPQKAGEKRSGVASPLTFSFAGKTVWIARVSPALRCVHRCAGFAQIAAQAFFAPLSIPITVPTAGNATKLGSVLKLTLSLGLAPKLLGFSNKLINLLLAAAVQSLEFAQ